jgi:hypothetical protein
MAPVDAIIELFTLIESHTVFTTSGYAGSEIERLVVTKLNV